MALLLVAIPLIAIGTLIWRLADRTRGLQASIESAAEKAAASSDGVKRIEANVSAMRDELHREYVRKDALKETETRISKRMDDVEHVVRNTATTIISALSGVEPTPRRRRPQP
jgi:biopolymer transport protein ExbB/TolQ